MNRNAPCPCGSLKRFKHCCGIAQQESRQTRFEALAAQKAGAYGRAEALYLRALEEDPQDVDSLHMLGVVQFERMRYRRALEHLWEAAEKTGWAIPQIRHNLGLVLAKLLSREANRRQADLLADFVAWEGARDRIPLDRSPLVTVVLPAYNHALYVAQAIASVAAQTYPHIELVVIDDGSTDRTPLVIAEAIAGLPFPVRYIARDNRGAPATLNEGAALARGQYVAFLNSDDHFAPDRIACLVDEIARREVRWGFTLVSQFGASPQADPCESPAAVDPCTQRQRNFLGRHPNSFTLAEYNVAVSSGNLFVERDFFLSVGGFRDFRYNHDWDFCLRAAAVAEPMVVHRPLYFYRRHGANTIGESRHGPGEEADRVFGEFLATALAGHAAGGNPMAPQTPANRSLLLKLAFAAGQGGLVPVPVLQSLAAELRIAPALSQGAAAGHAVRHAPDTRRTAVVVLGMHRSGTSALSRVLNLCGAVLPAKLKPPKLGVNPKGFWEPEAVLDLNVRVMRQLGGDWSRVDFALPTSGDLVDEFESDARAMLESEYGGEPTILLKDPRICVLAPLWHRALIAAGYRPVYVVPIRNPIEVAQSLHARGDMSVPEGLSLWLTYMKRVEAFADAHPDVMYIRFTELLEDWRGVVGRIADRLDVPLAAGTNADAVDRFLEPAMRRQIAGVNALDARAGRTCHRGNACSQPDVPRPMRPRRDDRAADPCQAGRPGPGATGSIFPAAGHGNVHPVHRKQRHPGSGASSVREHSPIWGALQPRSDSGLCPTPWPGHRRSHSRRVGGPPRRVR